MSFDAQVFTLLAMITYPWATRCPIFSQIEAKKNRGFPFFSLPCKKGVDTKGGLQLQIALNP